MLLGQHPPAQSIEQHDGAGDAGSTQLVQRIAGRRKSLAFVDALQHCVVTRFRTDIGQRQAGL